MHTYSINKGDKDLRAKVAVIIFGLSMVISLLLKEFCTDKLNEFANVLRTSDFKNVVGLVEWFEVNPNVLGIPFWYSILTFIYREYLWQFWLFRVLHGVPKIKGNWEGSLKSSFNGKTIPIEMYIKQNWNKISITCFFPKTDSTSNSNTASILVDSNKGTEICFGYTNDSYDVDNKLQSHDGYNILNLVDKNHIKARYFNNRDNPNPECKGGNKGSFELWRSEKTEKSK